METGILSMPAEQYFASEAVSNSDLKFIAPPYTPAHFQAYKAGQIEREETEAMRIGTITHRCILEPETMAGAFSVKPKGMKLNTKDGIAWAAEQGDRIIIPQAQADMIAGMTRSVWRHKEAKAIITGSDRERCLFAQEDSLHLKGRVDLLTRNGNIIADLKTIELCDLDSVEKQIFNYGYYRQAAFYLRLAALLGLKKDRFVLIFVEKTPPYCVALYSIVDDVLEAGRMEIERDLRVLAHCVAENYWPGRECGINEASLPTWAMKQLEKVI